MAQKVKCQHCWKVFEVPDSAVNKQRKCAFCQRITIAQPETDPSIKKKTAAIGKMSKKMVAPEEPKTSKISKLSPIFTSGIWILALVNVILLLLMLAKHGQSSYRELMLQEQKNWEMQLGEQLAQIDTALNACNEQLQEKVDKLGSEQETVSALSEKLRPSIKLIFDKISQSQKTLKRLQKDLQVLAAKNN